MANIPQKVADRITAGIKKFQPILTSARDHDCGEADTVRIITDMLSEIFGYDKYTEITSEKCIRGTYCDLAIKIDDVAQALIEAKAINQDLREGFVKQAVDYAANAPEGIDWVLLTNGLVWRVYRVLFSKPIDRELVVEINFLSLDYHANSPDIEMLFLFSKESWAKSALNDYYDQKQALSKFSIAAVLLTDPVLTLVKRELKHVSPDVKIDIDQIREVLTQEVLKRDVVDCEKAEQASKKIAKAANKAMKNKTEKNSVNEQSPVQATPPVMPPSVTPISISSPN
jgi:hypothetical protein